MEHRTPRALAALLDDRARQRAATAPTPVRRAAARPGTVLVTGATGGVGGFVLAMIRSFHPMAAEHPRLGWVLSRFEVGAVTEGAARAAAGLLKEAGLRGHLRAIDATVAQLALRLPDPVAMLMTDLDDVFRLCGGQVGFIGL